MNISSATALTSASNGRNASQTLGQKEFLNLLSTQMANQDPMNPMKDTDFIAQLAQFTSLEQAKNTSESMSMLQATSLLGKAVTVRGDSANEVFTGKVTGLEIKDKMPRIFLDDEKESFEMGRLLSVEPAAPEVIAPKAKAATVAQAPVTAHAPSPASWASSKLAELLNP